jgi:hypothetical protein
MRQVKLRKKGQSYDFHCHSHSHIHSHRVLWVSVLLFTSLLHPWVSLWVWTLKNHSTFYCILGFWNDEAILMFCLSYRVGLCFHWCFIFFFSYTKMNWTTASWIFFNNFSYFIKMINWSSILYSDLLLISIRFIITKVYCSLDVELCR